ncbi:MAG: 2-hydroxy-3-keto-5-methylthiopentenyl-1-phosphate phosphatase related protein [Ignavibacteriae bacterium]|nr:MAG: 2-hydroxy-3-keto-5-methylthiopentenyl-1-phosphate phosphatase related protein [Ignavibacteriota bacterium]
MLKIYIDFDGTISIGDVGYKLFLHFAGDKTNKIVENYINGKLTAIEFYEELIKACGAISSTDLFSFIDVQKIDTTFLDFLNFCSTKNQNEKVLDLFVVSDGFDLYIERILKKYQISNLKFFANKLKIQDNGKLTAEFPYTDEECTKCACCKRNHLLTLSADEDIIVYIGNGFSDQCAVNFADIVFARDKLQTYCQEKNISYYLYTNFNDVTKRLEEILQRKRIRKRQQAEFNRREVFISG